MDKLDLIKKIGGGYLSTPAAYVIDKFNIGGNIRKKFTEKVKVCYPTCERSYSKKEISLLYRDYLRTWLRYDYDMVDYFTYQFVKLNDKERKTYMQNSYRFVLDKVANNPEHCELFKDKGKFYKVFSKYVHRAVLSSEEAADENTFFDFCKKHNKIIVKPMDSHRGIGVEIIEVSTEEQIKNAYKKVLENKMVVEEVLTQNETMAKPHPNSINTLRIATAIDSNGETHIMSVCWRMGYGENCIDNASGGGIFAPVNPETGIVDRCAMDLNAKMYSFHPTSKELLVGIKIPKWEELKKLAVEVTKVVPDMKYIGWDWAMNGNDEWELIEGNNPGGVHMLQLLAGRGLKKDYDGVLLCKK